MEHAENRIISGFPPRSNNITVCLFLSLFFFCLFVCLFVFGGSLVCLFVCLVHSWSTTATDIVVLFIKVPFSSLVNWTLFTIVKTRKKKKVSPIVSYPHSLFLNCRNIVSLNSHRLKIGSSCQLQLSFISWIRSVINYSNETAIFFFNSQSAVKVISGRWRGWGWRVGVGVGVGGGGRGQS